MKLNSIFGQLLVVLFIFALIACNKEEEIAEKIGFPHFYGL